MHIQKLYTKHVGYQQDIIGSHYDIRKCIIRRLQQSYIPICSFFYARTITNIYTKVPLIYPQNTKVDLQYKSIE
jgi:hypothetical protein